MFTCGPVLFGGPTSGAGTDPHFANVVMLCHADGTNGSTTFTNVVQALGRGNTIGLNGTGSVTVSTASPLFGSGCASFPGGCGLASASSADYGMGTGDFTIEFAFKTSTPGQTSNVFDLRATTSSLSPTVYISSSQWVFWDAASGIDHIRAGTVATNTWQRIMVARVSGVTRMFQDGTQIGSNYTDGNNYVTGQCCMGDAVGALAPVVSGSFMDEMRLTKGFGRRSSNYTVDAAAFPDS